MIKIHTRTLFATLVLVWACTATAQRTIAAPMQNPSRPGDVTVYIAPDGDDTRSGKTSKEPVRSLARVQELLKAYPFKESDRTVAVLFAPGRYKGLEVIWDLVATTRTFVFQPSDYRPGERTVTIDGAGSTAEQFFLLRILKDAPDSAPLPTNIAIRGLHITNYCEGVSLGDWKSQANVAANVIEDNKFTRIGSRYQAPSQQADRRVLPTGACVAALRLQHASNNTVRNNVFEDIENLPARQTAAAKYGPLLMHAIYLSKNSSGNLIEGNRFERFSGSPVRIRAQSDGNRIVENSFASPLYPAKVPPGYRIKAISQWYCNDAVAACKERAEEGSSECPSLGIEIVGNRVDRGVELYADESQSKNSTCALPGTRSRGVIEPRMERNTVQP